MNIFCGKLRLENKRLNSLVAELEQTNAMLLQANENYRTFIEGKRQEELAEIDKVNKAWFDFWSYDGTPQRK